LEKLQRAAHLKVLDSRANLPNPKVAKYERNNNKTNENKTKKKNVIRINEAQLKKIVAESVKKVLRESEDFIPQGYKTMSNLGGSEIQISKSGDAARFRYYGGEPTEWMEIEFDEDGVAYVETPNGKELLADYMKY
jgi:hypothetical protein